MCGVVGYFGKPSAFADKAFTDLLFFDVVRGYDSTGVAFIGAEKGWAIDKIAGFPQDLIAFTDFKEHIRKQNKCLIGHNRAATRGKVNDENAHPFQQGDIIGVHNGTLTGKWRLKDHKDFDTDSEAIFYNIDRDGIDETYKVLDGAATLIYWDFQEDTLNMITNGQRPLLFARVKGSEGVYWASEKWMLLAIAERHKIEWENGIFKPNAHMLFTWTKEGGKVNFTTRKLSPFVPPVHSVTHSYGYSRTYNRNTDWARAANTTGAAQAGKTKAEKKAEKKALKQGKLELLPAPRDNLPAIPQRTQDWLDGLDIEKSQLPEKDRLTIRIHEGKQEAIRIVPALHNRQFTREEFENFFKECCFCGQHVDFEDETVEVFDVYSAACGECSTLSRIHHMKPPSSAVN